MVYPIIYSIAINFVQNTEANSFLQMVQEFILTGKVIQMKNTFTILMSQVATNCVYTVIAETS